QRLAEPDFGNVAELAGGAGAPEIEVRGEETSSVAGHQRSGFAAQAHPGLSEGGACEPHPERRPETRRVRLEEIGHAIEEVVPGKRLAVVDEVGASRRGVDVGGEGQAVGEVLEVGRRGHAAPTRAEEALAVGEALEEPERVRAAGAEPEDAGAD